MDKERVKSGLINAAPYIVAATAQMPLIFDNGNWFSILVFFTSAGFSWKLYKSGVNKYDLDAFFKSPVCQEYLGLYDEFVSDVAKMYSELGIDSGIQSAVAYKSCLDSGIFSCDETNRYALFENDSDYFSEFFGGRVTTGAHCCRHSASLFSDINNKMDKGCSPKISGYLDTKYCMNRKVDANHLISGLVHKNKKLLFDPTASFANMFEKGICYIQDDKVSGRTVAESMYGVKFTFVPSRYDNNVFQFNDKYDQFMKCESVKDSSELFDDFMEATFINIMNMKDYHDFHEEEKPKILQLSNLSKIVSPHGKEIVRDK